MNTGLRRGELLALRWSDIDEDQAFLPVVAKHAKAGKTRHLVLNSEGTTALKQRKEQHPSDDRVFPVGSSFKSNWKPLLKQAKIGSRLRWPDLRHHFASRLARRACPEHHPRALGTWQRFHDAAACAPCAGSTQGCSGKALACSRRSDFPMYGRPRLLSRNEITFDIDIHCREAENMDSPFNSNEVSISNLRADISELRGRAQVLGSLCEHLDSAKDADLIREFTQQRQELMSRADTLQQKLESMTNEGRGKPQE